MEAKEYRCRECEEEFRDEDGLRRHEKQHRPQSKSGESMTRRGEDVKKEEGAEAGRYDTGRKGKSQRPAGKSTDRDSNSVNPGAPKHSERRR